MAAVVPTRLSLYQGVYTRHGRSDAANQYVYTWRVRRRGSLDVMTVISHLLVSRRVGLNKR